MRFISRFRPSPAMVVASIALLSSLAGTSVAAVTLIAPNSVASRQVVDGSLRSRDLNAKQRSDTFSRLVVGPVAITRQPSIVATLRIPAAGTYVVWAKGYANPAARGTTADVTCDLLAGTSSDRTRAVTPVSATLALLVVHRFAAAGKVDVRCGTQFGAGAPANMFGVNLTALRTARLTASRTGSPTGS